MENVQDVQDVQDQQSQAFPAKKKHSGLGIASFIIALICILGLIGSMIFMTVVIGDAVVDPNVLDPGAINPEEALPEGFGAIVGASFAMMIFVILALVGAILGIVGLFQKERAKLFAILGTVFNALIVGVFAVLFVIGIVIGLSNAPI